MFSGADFCKVTVPHLAMLRQHGYDLGSKSLVGYVFEVGRLIPIGREDIDAQIVPTVVSLLLRAQYRVE